MAPRRRQFWFKISMLFAALPVPFFFMDWVATGWKILGALWLLAAIYGFLTVLMVQNRRRRTAPPEKQAQWLAREFNGKPKVVINHKAVWIPSQILAEIAMQHGYVFSTSLATRSGSHYEFLRMLDPSVPGGLVHTQPEATADMRELFAAGTLEVLVLQGKFLDRLPELNSVARQYGYYFVGSSPESLQRKLRFVHARNGIPPLPLPWVYKNLSPTYIY